MCLNHPPVFGYEEHNCLFECCPLKGHAKLCQLLFWSKARCPIHKKSWQTSRWERGWAGFVHSLETTSGMEEGARFMLVLTRRRHSRTVTARGVWWEAAGALTLVSSSLKPPPRPSAGPHTHTYMHRHPPPHITPSPTMELAPLFGKVFSVPTRFAQWGELGLSELRKGLGFGLVTSESFLLWLFPPEELRTRSFAGPSVTGGEWSPLAHPGPQNRLWSRLPG